MTDPNTGRLFRVHQAYLGAPEAAQEVVGKVIRFGAKSITLKGEVIHQNCVLLELADGTVQEFTLVNTIDFKTTWRFL